MDIYCPKCAEPLDMDELHYIDGLGFDAARKAFYADGCAGIGFTCSAGGGGLRADAAAAMYDLLGDDIDGAAAMLDDLEYLGMLDG